MLVLSLVVLGPVLMAGRSVQEDAIPVFRPFVYAGMGEIPDRALNSVRGFLRNVPLRLQLLDRLSPRQTVGCDRERSLCLEYNLAPTEDQSANLAPALVVLIGLALATVRWRALALRTRIGIASAVAAWGLFHAAFRDNVWLPRLQLPLFAVVTTLALAVFPAPQRTRFRAATVVLWALAAGAAAHSALAVVMNVKRPWAIGGNSPTGITVGTALSERAYYIGGPRGLREIHEVALERVAASGCRRLGMFIAEYSYDYPLSWRAMRRGVEVRHVVGPDPWPCAVFSDRGPPPAPPSGSWRSTDSPYLFFAAE